MVMKTATSYRRNDLRNGRSFKPFGVIGAFSFRQRAACGRIFRDTLERGVADIRNRWTNAN
jgi:hypothetical protein